MIYYNTLAYVSLAYLSSTDSTFMHISRVHYHKIIIWSSFYHNRSHRSKECEIQKNIYHEVPNHAVSRSLLSFLHCAHLLCVHVGTMKWFPGSNIMWVLTLPSDSLLPREPVCLGVDPIFSFKYASTNFFHTSNNDILF
jgi:hypothetical protein